MGKVLVDIWGNVPDQNVIGMLFPAEYSPLDYEIRALGRNRILSMTFIAATDQLAEINASRESVLAMAVFNQGSR